MCRSATFTFDSLQRMLSLRADIMTMHKFQHSGTYIWVSVYVSNGERAKICTLQPTACGNTNFVVHLAMNDYAPKKLHVAHFSALLARCMRHVRAHQQFVFRSQIHSHARTYTQIFARSAVNLLYKLKLQLQHLCPVSICVVCCYLSL